MKTHGNKADLIYFISYKYGGVCYILHFCCGPTLLNPALLTFNKYAPVDAVCTFSETDTIKHIHTKQ